MLESLKMYLMTAGLIEAVWFILKNVVNKETKKVDINVLGTIILGLTVAFSFEKGIFEMLNININHYVDLAFTGVLMSRGSNYVHNLLDTLPTTTKKKETINFTDGV